MSTAYYIVLNSQEPGFDTFIDGKALARRLPTVNKIAVGIGLKRLENFAFHDLSDFGGPESEPEWFDAAEGVNWMSQVLQHVRQHPDSVGDADAVADDLQACIRVLGEAGKRGFKWHLALDY